MELKLTERETELLREMLHDMLPLVEREVARTEKLELRHMLVERQNLVESLIERLGAAVS